ncbi:MAG: hypothetical protein VR70_01640 [Rhodospirillaceae bacterium BRH_c57]|nr:MAG: hypothetical protein VR70_01640 [Rhodospirillaceae bacterium BRH_c57]
MLRLVSQGESPLRSEAEQGLHRQPHDAQAPRPLVRPEAGLHTIPQAPLRLRSDIAHEEDV